MVMGAAGRGRRDVPMVPFQKRLLKPCGRIPATGVGAGADAIAGPVWGHAWCAEVTGVIAGDDTETRIEYFPSEITLMQHLLEEEVGVPDTPVWQVHNPLLLDLWRAGLWAHPPARKCHVLATSQPTEPISYAATISHLLSPPDARPLTAGDAGTTTQQIATPRAVPQRILGVWIPTCWAEAWGWVLHGFPADTPVAAYTTPQDALEHGDVPDGTTGAYTKCLVFAWVLADTGVMIPDEHGADQALQEGEVAAYNVKVDGNQNHPRKSVRDRNRSRVAAMKDKADTPPPAPHRAWVSLEGRGLLMFHPDVDAVAQYIVEVAPLDGPRYRGMSAVSDLTDDQHADADIEDEAADAARAALKEAERLAQVSQWVVANERALSRARTPLDVEGFVQATEHRQRREIRQDEFYVRTFIAFKFGVEAYVQEEIEARKDVMQAWTTDSRELHRQHVFQMAVIAERAAVEADEAHRAKLLFDVLLPTLLRNPSWDKKHAALTKVGKILKKIIRERMGEADPRAEYDEYSTDMARWCVGSVQQILVDLPDNVAITRGEGSELASMLLSAVELFWQTSDDIFFDGLEGFYLVVPQRIKHAGPNSSAAQKSDANILATSLAIAVPDTRTVTSWYSTLAGLVGDLGALFDALKATQMLEAAQQPQDDDLVDYSKYDELPPDFEGDNLSSFARVVHMAEAVLHAERSGDVGEEAQLLLKTLNPDVTEKVACYVLRAVGVINNIALLKRIPDRADEMDPEDKAKEGAKIFTDFVRDVITIVQGCGTCVAVLTHGFQVLSQLLAFDASLVSNHALQTLCFVTCHRLAHLQPEEAGDINKLISGLLGCLSVLATGSTLLKESMKEHNVVALVHLALYCFPDDGTVVDRSLGILTLFSTSLNLRLSMLQGGIAEALEVVVSHGAAARHPPLAAKAHSLLDVLQSFTQSTSFRSFGSLKRAPRESKTSQQHYATI